jgi:hypothetical protein
MRHWRVVGHEQSLGSAALGSGFEQHLQAPYAHHLSVAFDVILDSEI